MLVREKSGAVFISKIVKSYFKKLVIIHNGVIHLHLSWSDRKMIAQSIEASYYDSMMLYMSTTRTSVFLEPITILR